MDIDFENKKRQWVGHLIVAAVLCILFGGFIFLLSSSGSGWNSQPLFTGEMISIAVDPFNADTVYVGTKDAGVFKTTNGGILWSPARNGLSFCPIRNLVPDPENNGTLYAGTDFDGVYKTVNGGLSWVKTSAGLDSTMVVKTLVLDPDDSSILYAGLAGGLTLSIGNIYKSTNGAGSWTIMDEGIPRYSADSEYTNGIYSLTVNPTNSSIVYAGTQYDGAYVSINGGKIWSALNNCMPVSRSI